MNPIEKNNFEKALLKKRGIVETVIDELKNLCRIRTYPTSIRVWIYDEFVSRDWSILSITEEGFYQTQERSPDRINNMNFSSYPEFKFE